MAKRRPPVVTVDRGALESIVDKAIPSLLEAEVQALREVIGTYFWLTEQMRKQTATLARLRRFLGMTTSEKTRDVCGHGEAAAATGTAASQSTDGPSPPSAPPAGAVVPPSKPASDKGEGPVQSEGQLNPARPDEDAAATAKPKRPGHGRVPAQAYQEATCFSITHELLRPGERCLQCGCGRLYKMAEPARILRIVGQPPLAAVCWNCERLRCSGCGHVFTARAPTAAQGPKYDETAVAMMALLRYRAGVPLHRLDQLERNLATPVPASTQWDVVNGRVIDFRPVFDELRRVAAQGELLHNDDSYARILEFMGKRKAALLAKDQLPDPERTGIFTTAIVSITDGKPIAVFCTSRKHAGENLAKLLSDRSKEIGTPILMSDALERNVPKGMFVIEANCLAHGRRHVVDEVANFPGECAHLLGKLAKVFRIDHLCRRHELSPNQRLRVHQRWSAPVMADLQAWMELQFSHKRIEPNSGMGQAMNYLLKRWDKITRFLHVAGAPLDNNICERALKMAIRHRNNSLFYKTQHGAEVGDIYMTLIHTAELHGQNAFHYLTVLQRHAKAVAAAPADWLPWNYRETLARLAPETACAIMAHAPVDAGYAKPITSSGKQGQAATPVPMSA